MIRVVLSGPPNAGGFHTYRITEMIPGRSQFVGVSKTPLLDACRQLRKAGFMDETVVGLFDEGKYGSDWQQRTTVGQGAKLQVLENDIAAAAEAPRTAAVTVTEAPPAPPAEPPPPRHRRKVQRGEPSKPGPLPPLPSQVRAKRAKSHRPPPPRGSGGRPEPRSKR